MTTDTDGGILNSSIAAAIIGVSLLGTPALGAQQRVAFWPLTAGKSQVVRDQVGSMNGAFRTQDATKPLKWGSVAGKPALLFPGSTGVPGGHIEVGKGGAILSGPMFAVGLDVYLESDTGAASCWPASMAPPRTAGSRFTTGLVRGS